MTKSNAQGLAAKQPHALARLELGRRRRAEVRDRATGETPAHPHNTPGHAGPKARTGPQTGRREQQAPGEGQVHSKAPSGHLAPPGRSKPLGGRRAASGSIRAHGLLQIRNFVLLQLSTVVTPESHAYAVRLERHKLLPPPPPRWC